VTTAFAILAAVCWVFRVLFVILIPADRLPAGVWRTLTHLAPAVLAALVAAETDAAVTGASPLVGGYLIGSVLLVGLAAMLTRSLLVAITVSAAACLLLDLVLLG
jgi:branched-subunit amino acid transport protein